MIWPAKINRTPTAGDFNKLLEQVKRLEVVESVGVKIQERGSNGTKLRVAGSGTGSSYQDFTLCRNGESITIGIVANDDPTTVDANT